MDIWMIALALIGSALAGLINTLAGNGSVITLGLLTEVFGLPGNVANATNRVGIVTQSIAGVYAFKKSGTFSFGTHNRLLVLNIAGALIGIYLAIIVSNEQFLMVFKVLMVLLLVVVVVKPERWINPELSKIQLPESVLSGLYFLIGIYGGFIQMGMGVIFLAVAVLGAKKNLLDSNVVKIYLVGVYTFIAMVIFAWKGLIDWPIGLIFAIGQTIGGYYTAKFAANHPKSNIWAYRVLVVIMVVAVVKIFNLHIIIWELWISG
jgi:uncharacterized protein